MVEEGLSNEEIERRITARDMEMPDEVTLTYHLYCYDLETGELIWDRELYEGPPPVGRHRKNSYMSETPVTDGEAVYVYVGHRGLYAYDFAGTQLWSTELDAYQVYLDFGGGPSPALHGDRLFIVNDNEEASFIAAFDKRTGEPLWKTPRPELGSRMSRSAWSSPYVWESEQRSEIVTLGPGTAVSYDLDGQELWRMDRQGMMVAQTPFAWGGNVYLTSGSGGGGDRPLVAVRPGATGDITLEETATSSDSVLWYGRVSGGTYLPTPVVYDGGLYVLTDKGVFSLLDPKTGERIYRTRIHPQASNFTSSLWAYNGHVFCVNEEGDTFVVKAGNEFEFVGINSLDEWTLATPAIVGDRLLMRTQSRLYSIRDTGN
jgi:outer membrane protein assembly factor BamB